LPIKYNEVDLCLEKTSSKWMTFYEAKEIIRQESRLSIRTLGYDPIHTPGKTLLENDDIEYIISVSGNKYNPYIAKLFAEI